MPKANESPPLRMAPPPGFSPRDLVVNARPDTREVIKKSFNHQARLALDELLRLDMRTQRVTTVWLNATGFDQLGSRDMAMAFWTAMGYEPMATPAITKKMGWIPETFLVKKL